MPSPAEIPLIHCIYTSVATQDFTPDLLARLLGRSRRNNDEAGITGMLLFAKGNFFQALEGPPAAVDTLYDRIHADRRHRHVTRVIREPISERAFGSWTMGFLDVARSELAGWEGVNDFFDRPPLEFDDGVGRARKLLEAFREGRWRRRLAGESVAVV